MLIDDGVDGLLVDVGDADEMSERIRLLLEQSKAAIDIARAARSKVEGFDWESVKLQWYSLLKT